MSASDDNKQAASPGASPPPAPAGPVAAMKRVDSGSSKGPVSPDSPRVGGRRPRLDTQSSVRSRRTSLSLPHANSIPFGLGPPEEDNVDPTEVPWWTSKRLQLSFICFLGFFCLYSLRVNLSTAIVCMVKTEMHKAAKQQLLLENTTGNATYSILGNTTFSTTTLANFSTTAATTTTEAPLECPASGLGSESADKEGEFEWDKKLQGLILGAFFWGYTFMQIPSGYLSDRFGPRLTISLGMFPVAIITIISPFLARGSPYLLLVGRIIIGLGEGMMYPGMQSLWSKWAPPHERSRLVGFAFGGSQLGNALTFPLAGLLCSYGFGGGWPSVFYVIGMMSFCWCCLFVFFARNSPGEMTSITHIERKYIEQSLGVYGQTVAQRDAHRADKKPWKQIFTSGAAWAILLTNACSNYGAYMLLTQMPTYMKEVLHFDIKSNGVFSMIPYLVFWVFVILGGQIADLIIRKNILSIEWTRKLCSTLGTLVPGIFLVLTGYMDCWRQSAAVALLTLSMAFCGFQFSSFFINHGDIAPKYAGTVFGFTNMGASVPGIIAPYVVGAITPNKSREEWLVAFYIAGAIYALGAVIYIILAKGEVQEWAKEVDSEEELQEGLAAYKLQGITEEQEDKHENEKAAMLEKDRKNGVMFE